ncbi:MAG: GAF domain-containing protein [Coriobacteriia bacterium]|nr:GAF domain-containing protein [Coriobacteriia bacterium]MBN2841364.1 GAF domain-containing protein [Coriobacteriia bacterium]
MGDQGHLHSTIGKVWPIRGRARQRVLVPSPPSAQQALVDALDSVSESISSAGSVHDVLAAIVDAAKSFTGAEKVAVCLVDEYADGSALDETTLVVRGARDTHLQEWWGQRLSDITDDVFRNGNLLCDVDRERGAWLLAVPVRVQGEPLGVLIAINSIRHSLLPEHSAFLSILGAFAAVSIANARLAEDGRHAMLASERERIAREMHDGISQSLFSVSLGLELAKRQVVKDPAQARCTLEDLEGQLGAAAGELRRLVYDLRPKNLQELGLVEAVRTWVHEATCGGGVRGSVEVEGEAQALRPSQEACLYRIAKEAVSNAVRHSGGQRLVVRIAYAPELATLVVSDDGNGIAHSETQRRLEGTGAGLRNMRERMDAEGGWLEVSSEPGTGTVVRAVLPLEVD